MALEESAQIPTREGETWVIIGPHRVSSEGRLWSNKHMRIMKPVINNAGYERIGVGSKFMLVHVLVAQAFYGLRPHGFEVDHINRIKTDNRAVNLRYCSRGDNRRNCARAGTLHARGIKNPCFEIKFTFVNGQKVCKRVADKPEAERLLKSYAELNTGLRFDAAHIVV